jgi:hypothetical protein
MRRVGAVLLGLGAAFVLAEIGLRVSDWQPPSSRSKLSLIDRNPTRRVWFDCYATNPAGEFRALPDVSKGTWTLVNNMLPPEELQLASLERTPWCVEYKLSSQGLRDVERAPRAAAGVVRIALVGDSFVFGEGVPVERALPAQLQMRLGASREVLNLGWSGDDTQREIARLEGAIDAFHLERAIIVFIANDIEMTPELQREQDYIHDLVQIRDRSAEAHRARLPWLGWSHVLRLLAASWDMRHVKERTIRWYRDLYDPARNAAGLERFAAALRKLAHLKGCRAALVLYPLLEGLESGYPLHEVHEHVAAMARDAGLSVLDLAPAFAGEDASHLWVHPSDHHPDGRAHSIAARAIGDWLERDLPDFLRP